MGIAKASSDAGSTLRAIIGVEDDKSIVYGFEAPDGRDPLLGARRAWTLLSEASHGFRPVFVCGFC